jgi:hypothetical protein
MVDCCRLLLRGGFLAALLVIAACGGPTTPVVDAGPGGCGAGLQDNDGNGTCEPTCDAANLGCVNGACSDATGTATCTCQTGSSGAKCDVCVDGYQDKDGNGTCEPTCATASLGCVNGTCSDSSGAAQCECIEGYAGSKCDECAVGFQDNDKNGTCDVTCEKFNPCAGTCVDTSGQIECVCDPSRSGQYCETCADGYQDNNNDGSCEPTCATANLGCFAGTCSDGSGTPACQCDPGYDGALCDVCAEGYQDKNNDGTCEQGCDLAALSCVWGLCDDSSGTAACACDVGYTGALCDACANGYQDHNTNGTCEPSCDLMQPNCGYGHCDDGAGTVMCACDQGYDGAACDACAGGYQDKNANGTCEPTCATANLGCVNGACVDSSGTPLCACDTGYQGTTCDQCADGYQDNNSNGTCEQKCASANLGCVNGACADSSGTPLCACDPGYKGATCEQCADGYQDNDGNGICEPTCASVNLTCGHGQCADSSGTAACACDTGYQGTACDQCAAGYQDNNSNGTCEPTCATANLGCVQGACVDTSGTAVCACDDRFDGALCDTCATGFAGAACDTCAAGYTGAACDVCDTNYQDNDHDGTCEPSCATVTCSVSGSFCTDDVGPAKCAYPETCAEIAAHNPAATDGSYALYHQGKVEQAWNAWCHNMGSQPAEYLALQKTGAEENYSLYKGGGFVEWSDIITTYQRIRINPKTLVVNVNDRVFSSSSGYNGSRTWMPYGTGENCSWYQQYPGTANVNLSGTRFRVSGPFCVEGWAQWGTVTVDPSNDQIVSLVGGGQCGGVYPHVSSCTEPADPDGWNMQLEMKPCPTGTAGADCAECAAGYSKDGSGQCVATP